MVFKISAASIIVIAMLYDIYRGHSLYGMLAIVIIGSIRGVIYLLKKYRGHQ